MAHRLPQLLYHKARGDDMVVSGLKNKVNVAMSNVMPDKVVAENMHKKQAPANKKK